MAQETANPWRRPRENSVRIRCWICARLNDGLPPPAASHSSERDPPGGRGPRLRNSGLDICAAAHRAPVTRQGEGAGRRSPDKKRMSHTHPARASSVPRTVHKNGPRPVRTEARRIREDYGMERAVREGDTGLHPTLFPWGCLMFPGTAANRCLRTPRGRRGFRSVTRHRAFAVQPGGHQPRTRNRRQADSCRSLEGRDHAGFLTAFNTPSTEFRPALQTSAGAEVVVRRRGRQRRPDATARCTSGLTTARQQRLVTGSRPAL